MPVPVTSRDCISPFTVKLTLVLAATVLVGVNRTVTVAVAPIPSRVKGLPEYAEGGRYGGRARGGAGTGALNGKGPGGGAPDSDVAEAYGTGGVTAESPRATALATAEHALSFPSVSTAVTETL